MNSSYWIGVAAAVAARVIFNLGILIQKLAVMKTTGKVGLSVFCFNGSCGHIADYLVCIEMAEV